jgi:hypothetical protein
MAAHVNIFAEVGTLAALEKAQASETNTCRAHLYGKERRFKEKSITNDYITRRMQLLVKSLSK